MKQKCRREQYIRTIKASEDVVLNQFTASISSRFANKKRRSWCHNRTFYMRTLRATLEKPWSTKLGLFFDSAGQKVFLCISGKEQLHWQIFESASAATITGSSALALSL